MSDAPSPAAREEASARCQFLLWFADPFRTMEERGNGHGAFASLSIGLFLCERYFRYKSDSIDQWREEAFLQEAARHFQTDYAFFRQFWAVYRHGMYHRGAPGANADYGWDIHEDYPPAPTCALQGGKPIICFNPWAFTEEMIALCWNDPAALAIMGNLSVPTSSTDPLQWEPVPPPAAKG